MKAFAIPEGLVWQAWKQVNAKHGAAGVDAESIAAFESKLAPNLYKLWNRMNSGSYFPSPVRRVWIPKADGKERPLGIPTVEDRVAQRMRHASASAMTLSLYSDANRRRVRFSNFANGVTCDSGNSDGLLCPTSTTLAGRIAS